MKLAGRTVLITGGRRVGTEVALAVASRGARVAMTYRSSRRAIEEAVGRVEAAGSQGLAIHADLTDPQAADHVVGETVRHFGALDVLVNMTSDYARTPFDRLTPADFEHMLAANLKAPYLTAVAAAKAMLRQPAADGVKGKIINFADWAVFRPYKDYLPYLVAKGGLVTLTLALAQELAPHVHVNAIAPAMIDPPPDMTPAEIEAVRQATPLRRIGSAADVVNLVLYLIEGTDFATGEVYRVDGGRFLSADA